MPAGRRGDVRPLRSAALSFLLLIAWDVAGSGAVARPFLPAPVYGVGHNPTRLATADFNGDGRADVAVANAGNSGESITVGLLLADGGGLFRDGGIVTTLPAASSVAVLFTGEFNADGKPDLLVETGSGSTFTARVLLGQGNGTFTAVVPDLALPGRLTVGDSNADGRLDLLVRSGSGPSSQLRVWLGAGNGTFSALAPFPAPVGIDFGLSPFSAADLTGDHVVDVVATSSTGTSSVVLTGTTLGTFVVGQTVATTKPSSVSTLDDASGDGVLDLVVQVQNAINTELRAYRGHGDGTFDAAPYWTQVFAQPAGHVSIGDLNRDGHPDLVRSETFHGQIMMGTATSFTLSTPFNIGDDVRQSVLGDFDGARGLDVGFVAAIPNTVTFVLARADGTYLPTPLPDPYPLVDMAGVAAADFNGDGRADMAALHSVPNQCLDDVCNYGEVEVRLAQPGGGFTTTSTQNTGDRPQTLHVADLDLDGKPDIIVVNLVDDPGTVAIEPGTLSLYRGHGDGTFDAPVSVAIGTWPRWAAAGDLDHDGDIDIAEVNGNSNTVMVLLRNGAGTYVPQTPIAVGRSPLQVDMTDIDGDGTADLVVTSRGNPGAGLAGEVSWLRGHGNGTFDPRVVITSARNCSGLAVADVDGDGDVDLAVNDAGDPNGATPADPGGLIVLLHQAGSTFVASTPYPAGIEPLQPQFADFNGDGALDLMAYASSNLAVLPGLGGGLFGPMERFAALGGFFFTPARLVGDGDLDLFGSTGNLTVFENEADQNPDLRFLDNVKLNWDPISFVSAFDVIQGNQATLRSSGGNFGAAVQACLQNNGAAHTVDTGAPPPVGTGFFYLVRAVRPNGTGGSYDGEMPGQAAPRDASIAASASACP